MTWPRFTVRRMMVGVAGMAALIVYGTLDESRSYSCHLCHNRKGAAVISILGLPIVWQDIPTTQFPIAPGHIHRWSCRNRKTLPRFVPGSTMRGCSMGTVYRRQHRPRWRSVGRMSRNGSRVTAVTLAVNIAGGSIGLGRRRTACSPSRCPGR